MTRQPTAAVLSVGLLATLVVGVACSSSSSSGNGANNPDADVIGCMGRGDVYTTNMQKAGTSGHIQFVLQSSQPGPPIVGHNVWTVQLLDGTGKPLPGAMFTWLPGDKSIWMPDHGHGQVPPQQVMDNGDGTYTLNSLYFYMAGLWQVTLQVSVGMMTDSVVYSFCVGG